MKKMRNKSPLRILRPLVSAMLVASGLFQQASPLLAQITAGGETINNTATAEYDNDNDPGNGTLNSTSNTVSITVAEVAGITVSPQLPVDINGGAILPGDALNFDFLVTNVGNDPTRFFLPGANNIGVVGATINSVQVTEVNGIALPAPVTIPAGGQTTDILAVNPAGNPVGSFNPDDNLTVMVNVTVNPAPAGSPISVRFGDTGNNNNDAGTQNQPDNVAAPAGDGAPNLNDVRTVDNADPAVFTPGGEVAGLPANGEREAAATQSATVAATIRPLALATVLKTRGAVNNSGTITDINDDIIPYNLQLNVSGTNVGGFTAGNLEGTSIQLLDNETNPAAVVQTVDRILISDAIPAGTVLTGIPQAPPNWRVVYTVQATGALPVAPVGATPGAINTVPVNNAPGTPTPPPAAVWQTLQPTDLTQITRVGFIFDPAANGVLPPTTSITGFQFTVVTTNVPGTGGTVANIAQVFGQTEGDPTDEIVYDESGDQNPNNFSEDAAGNPATPPDATGTAFNPAPNNDSGVANPAKDGVDANNNNTGLDNNPVDPDGPGGEANVITLSPNNNDILNGPAGFPGAIGPVDNNDDFTNQSIFGDNVNNNGTPANNAGNVPTPGPVIFTNTVQNPTAGPIADVVLLPLRPSEAQQATNAAPAVTNAFGVIVDPVTGEVTPANATVANDNAIPDGTVVTITSAAGVAAVYNYTAAGGFVLDVAATTTANGGTPLANGELDIGTLPPGGLQNYTVTVQLPDGVVPQNREILIPIVAFSENSPGTGFDLTQATDTVFNITVDRVYTGYLRLVKEARLLNADATPAAGAEGQFSQDPTFNPQPGQIIEYRITYTNISTAAPAGGTNNSTLNANSVVITENGTGVTFVDINGDTFANNWARDINTDGVIDTSNVVGSSTTTTGTTQGTVQFFSGPAGTTAAVDRTGNTQTTDVTAYINNVGTVIPQGSGTFTFQRRLPTLP